MKWPVILIAATLLSGCANGWDETRPETPAGGLGIQPGGETASAPEFTASIAGQPSYNGDGAIQPFGTSGEPTAYEFARGYRIGSGDRLTIRVLGQQDLTGDYLVDGAGNISMPLVRTVPVGGLSTREIESMITDRLQAGFLRSPSVSVQVAVSRPFYILGEVNQAGNFPYQHGMTVQNAIAVAGGYSARADHREVLITRKDAGGTRTLKVPVTTQVFPGDVVFVRERWF